MLLDLFFPKYCAGCKKIGKVACDNCLKSALPILADFCIYCYKPTLFGITHPLCKKKYGVDGTCSLYKYSGVVKKIIKQSKYQRTHSWYKNFFEIVDKSSFIKLELLISKFPNFSIQPIPLHPNREKFRGFNQALLISEFLSKKYMLKISDSIIRITDTLPQAQIANKKDRLNNMKNCFSLKKTITQNRVLLIDDVWTTGATLKDATKVLKKNGTKTVVVFTIAHG